ncbi:MAG: tetratricopeptide repeat protein [Vicinamibacterales bacterium]
MNRSRLSQRSTTTRSTLPAAPMFFRHLSAIVAVLIATLFTFLPLLENGFVNWDDPVTLQNNPHLATSGVVAWAFTTNAMGHYQPLAWLVWSQTMALFGLDAAAFHGLSLLSHLLNAALVYLIGVRLATLANLETKRIQLSGVAAAFVFAVHPIRVEAVAWASAFPYVLSLTFLLAAFLSYLKAATSTLRPAAGLGTKAVTSRSAWLGLSVGAYALSQLTRASAIAFPLVLLAADVYPLRRLTGERDGGLQHGAKKQLLGGVTWNRLFLEKLPFFAIALGVALAEAHARELATLQEIGPGARLALATAAPFVYLGRTLLPLQLTPLDPLPIEPRLDWIPLALNVAGLAAITVAAWRARGSWPVLAVAWTAYLLLLAPAIGLTPSGQQATADRYMYLPGVVVSLVIGVAATAVASAESFASPIGAGGRRRRAVVAVLGLGAALALGAATRRQTLWWHDSVALWSRAVELDPRNDIATYNLAIALADAGREEEAMTRYEQTLQLVPDHAFARHNLNIIRAVRAEREADRLAQAGEIDAAIDAYARALAVDPTRLHARAARGMALVGRRRFAEAATDLQIAMDAAVRPQTAPPSSQDDRAVANALAFALMQTARHADAVAVLKQALGRHPGDHEIAHNLARLLATAPDPAVRDPALALRLALAVRDQTGGRDPRVLDTVAAAYAAAGRLDLARNTAHQAVTLARQLGELDLAREIHAHAAAYDKTGARRR